MLGPALCPSVEAVGDGSSVPRCGVTASASCPHPSCWAWVKVPSATLQGNAAALLGLVPITCSGCNQSRNNGLEDEVKEPGPVRLGCSSIINKQTEGEKALSSYFPGLLCSEAVPGALVLPSAVGGRAGSSSWCSRFVLGGEGDSRVLMKQMADCFQVLW